uniref:C2H2-type domain-containing protein n=1 Tax=Anopheles atroparvus TaxID=41427 RepID=A0AAG5DIG7_ANOAO
MADREAVNQQLRESVHNELDQVCKLLTGICDDTVRAAGERKYNQLFKLVEDRSKRVRSDSLKQIIIAAEILKESLNEKFIEQENAKIVEIPVSKIEKADIMDEEIYKLASSYDSERIALKYRRKKVEVPNDILKVPNVPIKRASSPLFLRRHEVFLPPKSTAATYGEHKRQMLLMRPEAIVPRNRSLLPSNQSSSVDPRVEHYRRVAKYVPPSIPDSRPILSVSSYQNNEIAQTGSTKNDLVEVVSSENNTNEGTKNTSEATPQCIATSSEQTCDVNQKPNMKEKMNNLATSVNGTTGKDHESDAKTTIDTEETTDDALNTRCVSDTSSQSQPSLGKLMKARNSGQLTRELNDLITNTIDYIGNYERKKQVNKNEQALLKKFGINKIVKVVLKDAVTNGSLASVQMQCKSLHVTKESSREFTLRRRRSVFVENRTDLELQDLQKSKKRRKKAAEDEDSLKRLPKAIKSTSRGQDKNKKAILHSTDTLNSDTAPKKQSKSSTLPEPAKTPTKRKLQRKSGTDVPKKRILADVPEGESISLQTIETTSMVNYTYNNKEEIHCHSEYMAQCRLCDFKDVRQTDIVNHYVYHHPASEVIVSRITPEQARMVKQNPFAVSGKRVVSRYGYQTISFRCHFCEMRNTLKESDWIHHLVNHTGEYRFRCRACPAMARTSDESVTHEEICGDSEMIVCNDIFFEENHVYGYMCEVCNFIQIRRFNMDRHLRREHPFQAVTCIRFSLVNYQNDHEDASTGSYYTSVKMEPMIDDDCSGILNSIPFVKDERIDDEEVLDTLPLEPIVPKQEVFLDFAENEEPCLPELLKHNERTLEQTLSFNDCANSNDSNSNLPTLSFDEETMQNLGTDMLKAQTCEQGRMLLEDVKNENINVMNMNMNETSHAMDEEIIHPKDPVPATNSVKFFQIRPRLLSGDSLSNHFNEEQIVTNKTHNGNASCSIPATHTKMVYPINVVVKPWIEQKSIRFSSHYSKEITYKCLGSFYKCMGDGCSFHSDENENMRQHLANHWLNDTPNRISLEKSWLECCYCQHFASDVDSLLSHLNFVHKNCAFQCNRCFYRSREASSVVIHQSTYHVDDESCNMILECTKQYKKFSLVDQDAIIAKMDSTIEMLKCTACNSKIHYDLLEYKTHLLAHEEQCISCHICHFLIPTNSMLKHLKSHHIFLYQCVHCVYGTDQKYVIKNHVSREHAEEICCFHIREGKRTNSGNVPNAFVPIPLRPFVRVEETISNDRLRTYC